MPKAASDLSVPLRLVNARDRVEILCKQGDAYVSWGECSVHDASQLLSITTNWMCAVLTLSKGKDWCNGFYWLRLVQPETIDTSASALKRLSQ